MLSIFKLIFLLLLAGIPIQLIQAQTPIIDGLKQKLKDPLADQLNTLFEICHHGESMPADSELYFAKKAEQISLERKDIHGRLLSEFYIAVSYNMKGRADTALRLCEKGIKEIPDTNRMFDVYRDMMWYRIVSLTKLRKIKESIDECYRLLEEGEKHGDILAQGIASNCLGVNYNVLLNRNEALHWFNQAYQVLESDSSGKSYLQVFVNLSAVYFYRNNPDSAFFFLNQVLARAREGQNLKVESDCLTLQGLEFTEQNKMDSAEFVLQKAFAIQKQIGNIQYIIVGLDALETFYARQKNYQKAIDYIHQAETYSRKYNEPLVFQFYLDLAECYKQLKNYEAYGETLDSLMNIKDSVYQKSKAVELARLEAQYDLTSKEAFIAHQKLELLHKDLWFGGSIVFIMVVFSGGYLLLRRNRRNQRLALHDAEEKERKRIAADLHDNIGAYASAISAGVDEIENRQLIKDPLILRHLKGNATEIINSLRDTIWAFNKESVNLTGISDRIKIYIQKLQPSYPQISIQAEESIEEDIRLSPIQALQLFRIVQEALNNALKHSQGNRILVQIGSDLGQAWIRVRDNGQGFEMEKRRNTGNGLTNMMSRAREAGFECKIESSPQGTLVHLTSKPS
jgi:signal transduction histidine kinase